MNMCTRSPFRIRVSHVELANGISITSAIRSMTEIDLICATEQFLMQLSIYFHPSNDVLLCSYMLYINIRHL